LKNNIDLTPSSTIILNHHPQPSSSTTGGEELINESKQFFLFQAMAEGASLSKFVFDHLKQEDKKQGAVTMNVYEHPESPGMKRDWREGCILAEGQNFARELMETPANLLTPRLFTEKVAERFSRLSSIEVIVRYIC
jgi:aminopeptidase